MRKMNMIKLEDVQKFTNAENGKQYVIETGTLHMQRFYADH